MGRDFLKEMEQKAQRRVLGRVAVFSEKSRFDNYFRCFVPINATRLRRFWKNADQCENVTRSMGVLR